MKQALRVVVKVIAAIAAVAFFRANPFSANQGIAFLISIAVLLACLGVLTLLKDRQGHQHDDAAESNH